MNQSYIDTIYSFFVQKRPQIISLCKVFYFLQLAYIGFTLFLRLTKHPLFGQLYPTAIWSGDIAVTLFLLILLPGIARRFGIKHKLISLLMIYRRYTGIAMFLFVAIHAWMIRFIPIIAGYIPPLPRPVFETAGLIGYFLLLPLFLTSNDWSVKFFKQKWYLLHRLVYIIMWLILFHLILQGLSYASIIALLTVGLTSAGMLYQKVRSLPETKLTP